MKGLKESKLSSRWGVYRDFLKRKTSGVMTGIGELDRYLQGLGGFVNIQGETSSCKSSLALQIVRNNLKQGMPCVMLDKENGDGRILSRLMCQESRLCEDEIYQMSENSRKAVESKIDGFPLHIHTEQVESRIVLEERLAECWNLYQKPFLLLVDSIQAMDKLTEDQRVNLEEWVYFLDRLKVEYCGKLTVVVVSEKNRVSYGQQGVGGGKGSNVLDYKPETVLDVKWNEESDTFTVHVSKHRDGRRGGTIDLQKVFSNPKNPRSFCFLLEEAQEEETLDAVV